MTRPRFHSTTRRTPSRDRFIILAPNNRPTLEQTRAALRHLRKIENYSKKDDPEDIMCSAGAIMDFANQFALSAIASVKGIPASRRRELVEYIHEQLSEDHKSALSMLKQELREALTAVSQK